MNQLDQNNVKNTGELPIRALDQIPTAKADAKQIVGLVKEKGKISGYQLSDGRIVDKEQGVLLAKQGSITGVGIAHRKGSEYLKSIPDNTEDNNLSNLPTVSGKTSL